MSSNTKETPEDFLKNIMGKEVIVKLNSGVDYTGRLMSLDGFMNLAMEQTKEIINGRMSSDGTNTKSYGDAFIRGNNVMYISPSSSG